MKFLVTRTDALRAGHTRSTLKTSELWPVVVDYGIIGEMSIDDWEAIVRKAWTEQGWDSYIGRHEYLVVPLADARVISFRPKKEYTVEIFPYHSG